MRQNIFVKVNRHNQKFKSILPNLELFWRCAEVLANMFGRILPTIPYVERRVADEYLRLVKLHGDNNDCNDTQTLALHCPSYPAKPSARAIGTRTSVSRSFRFLNRQAFVASTAIELKQRDFDLRYVRLSGPCVTKVCAHWTGSDCRLGRAIANVQLRVKATNSCPIRGSCRWFFENSEIACRTCKFLPYSKLLNFAPEKI